MADLRTNYKDDVFEGKRKYMMERNEDSSVSFTDVTSYTQQGDYYGAAEINAQNQAINQKGLVVSDTAIPVAERVSNNIYFFH